MWSYRVSHKTATHYQQGYETKNTCKQQSALVASILGYCTCRKMYYDFENSNKLQISYEARNTYNLRLLLITNVLSFCICCKMLFIFLLQHLAATIYAVAVPSEILKHEVGKSDPKFIISKGTNCKIKHSTSTE